MLFMLPDKSPLFFMALLVVSLTCSLGSCFQQRQPERLVRLQQTIPQVQAKNSDSSEKTSAASDDTVNLISHRVTLSTNKGEIILELYGNDAPKTVENFVTLAKRRVFDGILVHRIAKNFIVQMGDPKTKDKRKKDEWGTGGESTFGEPFADELNPETISYKRGYKRGTVAAANRGPDTNTSQFFICLRDLPELPLHHTIFGTVAEGMEVVDSIAAEPIQPALNESDGRPIKPVQIRSVKISAVK